MAIITFVFLFCVISCASASHGVEMDEVTFAGDVVKGTAKQLDKMAIKTGQLLRKRYTVDQATDGIGGIAKAERKLQGILQGTAINGLHWPAIGIPRSLLACGGEICDDVGPDKRLEICKGKGCSVCEYEKDVSHYFCE